MTFIFYFRYYAALFFLSCILIFFGTKRLSWIQINTYPKKNGCVCKSLFNPLFFKPTQNLNSSCLLLEYDEKLCNHIKETEKHSRERKNRPCSQWIILPTKVLECYDSKCEGISLSAYPSLCSFLYPFNKRNISYNYTWVYDQIHMKNWVKQILFVTNCSTGPEHDLYFIQCITVEELRMENFILRSQTANRGGESLTKQNKVNILFLHGVSRAQFYRKFKETAKVLENVKRRIVDLPKVQSTDISLNGRLLEKLKAILNEEFITVSSNCHVQTTNTNKETYGNLRFNLGHPAVCEEIIPKKQVYCFENIRNDYALETAKVMMHIHSLKSIPKDLITEITASSDYDKIDASVSQFIFQSLHYSNRTTIILSDHGSLLNVHNSVHTRIELSNPLFVLILPNDYKPMYQSLKSLENKLLMAEGVIDIIEAIVTKDIVRLRLQYHTLAESCSSVNEPFLCVCQEEKVPFRNDSIHAAFAGLVLSKISEQAQNDDRLRHLNRGIYYKPKGLLYNNVYVSHKKHELQINMDLTCIYSYSLQNQIYRGELIIKYMPIISVEVLIGSQEDEETSKMVDTSDIHDAMMTAHFGVVPKLHRAHHECVYILTHQYFHSVLFEILNICKHETFNIKFKVRSKAMMTSHLTDITLPPWQIKVAGFGVYMVHLHPAKPRVSFDCYIS